MGNVAFFFWNGYARISPALCGSARNTRPFSPEKDTQESLSALRLAEQETNRGWLTSIESDTYARWTSWEKDTQLYKWPAPIHMSSAARSHHGDFSSVKRDDQNLSPIFSSHHPGHKSWRGTVTWRDVLTCLQQCGHVTLMNCLN